MSRGREPEPWDAIGCGAVVLTCYIYNLREMLSNELGYLTV
jgi:hypothetical protein